MTLTNYVQGSFTADGNAHSFNIPSGFDMIEVENLTKMATAQNGTGVRFLWQKGMAAGSALQYTTDGTGVLKATQITTGGFTLLDTSIQTPGSLLTGTTITNAAPPVCSSANTGGLANGNIVRIINCTGAPQLNGYDFTVGSVTANTSFSLAYMGAPGNAGTAFYYRILPNNPQFYPARKYIVAATQANPCVITLSTTHGLTVGQYVTFNVPSAFGMTQLNGQRAVITAISTAANTITVNLDSTSFTAFAFPNAASAATPFTPAQVIPFGDGIAPPNSAGNQDVLDGSTYNQSVRGVIMGGGANGPAGQSSDVIYWRAWRASQVQTTYFS